MDVRRFDREAVLASVVVATRLTSDDLGKPTPCAGWTVADLLAHMITQHYGFAAAAAGNGGDPDIWAVRPLDSDPAAAYEVASDAVLAAFADPDVLQRGFRLPEISEAMEFAAQQAISFHFIDYVAHGWDLAKSLDVPLVLDEELLDAAFEVAMRVPTGAARLAPGASFAPVVSVPDGAGRLEQVVAVLGRSPYWTPPPASS